jgi:hypothetical protein
MEKNNNKLTDIESCSDTVINQYNKDKDKDFFNKINQIIFEQEDLNLFATTLKVNSPVSSMSYLDFDKLKSVNNSYLTLSRNQENNVIPNEITLNPCCQAILQKDYQISSSITREQVQTLNDFGVDIIPKIESILISEAKINVWKEVLNIIDENAEVAYRKSWTDNELKKEKRTSWIHNNLSFLEKWLPKWFKGIYKKQIVITSKMDFISIKRKILAAILNSANMIAKKSRTGAGNLIITNCQIGTILQDFNDFIPTELKLQKSIGVPYKIGTYMKIDVFIDPIKSWQDNTITICKAAKKGTSEQGIYIPYMGCKSINIIAEASIAPKIILNFRFAPVFVGQDNADKYYEKIYFKFEKTMI